MAEVNVLIPDDLLEQVDSIVAELQGSRSGFVQEATAHYVTHVRDELDQAQSEKAIHEARDGMRKLSTLMPSGEDGALLHPRDRD
jgi:metal-responsive CopG/Arc/MetJ family transcriptional regulator